jgi:2-polyprenyl-3-methyl-5-hydroxy-6-metoxy-1,4-benzoquinol methylase
MSYMRGGKAVIDVDDLRITDSRYGQHMPLYRCGHCGFLQCDLGGIDITDFYARLEDTGYTDSSRQRQKQFRHLISQTRRFISAAQPRVLDIGAGTGLFVREALDYGWDAVGIEPSKWLSAQAQNADLPVLTGTFPHPEIRGRFDAIYLTDVIEHLQNPFALVSGLKNCLGDKGIVIVVTPDVSSIVAKLLGEKWWHFRMAHIGYFNKQTLNALMRRADLSPINYTSARWYFGLNYMAERIARYVPFVGRWGIRLPEILVPLNFFDSVVGIFGTAR